MVNIEKIKMLQSEYINLDLELCDLIGEELALKKRLTELYNITNGDLNLNDNSKIHRAERFLSYVSERRSIVEDRINIIEYAVEGIDEFEDNESWWQY